jgi:cytochrome c peroxidase
MRAAGKVAIVATTLASTWCASIGFCDSTPGEEYAWHLPPGFPRPVVPADNPMSAAKVALGCRLFFEPRLSVTGTYSCASCHEPQRAFTDGRAKAVGATGAEMTRGAMSLTNVAYSPAYTWASNKVQSLEAQMEQPLFNDHPIEIGLKRDDAALAATLGADYARSFAAAFPDTAAPVTIDNTIKAIAAFERTLISGRSAFDRYVFDDDREAMSAEAKQGMGLFFSDRAGCSACHSGLNFSGPIVHRGAPRPAAAFANNGTRDPAAGERDTGLMAVTGKPADLGRFRVPTLRNIELTAPYMHDGRFKTLEEVVAHYASGGHREPGSSESVDPAIRPLDLNDADRRALIAFLRSLTDTEFVSTAAGDCAGRR